jgi:hypothetical protein
MSRSQRWILALPFVLSALICLSPARAGVPRVVVVEDFGATW